MIGSGGERKERVLLTRVEVEVGAGTRCRMRCDGVRLRAMGGTDGDLSLSWEFWAGVRLAGLILREALLALVHVVRY